MPRRHHPDLRSPIESSPNDIPLARRRSAVTSPSRRTPVSIVFQLLAFGLIVLTGCGLLILGPFRGLLQTQPVPGLRANLSPDGRLLGHFPYPEAQPTQLVAVAPGLLLRADAAKNFLAMQRAAAADGITLNLLSAFPIKRGSTSVIF